MRQVGRSGGVTAILVGLPAAVALGAMIVSRTGWVSTLAGWDVAWTAAALSALAGTVAARCAAFDPEVVRAFLATIETSDRPEPADLVLPAAAQLVS